MSISLDKGHNISLSKEEPGLSMILIGLGWDARATDGDDFDLDASIFMLAENGKVRSDADFIFYGQLKTPDESIVHTGDNLTGEGDHEDDDEAIKVDLTRIPADIKRLAITVTFYDAEARRQNFGMVENAYVRVVNDLTGREIMRYDLNEDFSLETALIFGEVYRHAGEWKFRAIGQGSKGGLAPLARNFGVDVD